MTDENYVKMNIPLGANNSSDPYENLEKQKITLRESEKNKKDKQISLNEVIESVEAMIQSYEGLPQYAMMLHATNADYLSLLLLLSASLKALRDSDNCSISDLKLNS